jgi:isopenicillin-N epimerase
MLKPGICFLNHGSFGAAPREIFDAQNQWRLKLEAEPVELIGRRCLDLLDRAKEAIGPHFGLKSGDFGFVTNATDGVNAVLQSLRLSPGDELLTTGHVYNAVRQAIKLVARRAGATYRELPVSIPVKSPAAIRDQVLGGISNKTRLLVIDHVTSPTGLVFPVAEIIAGCSARGVEVLVDGAHAPGMIRLNVEQLGATYYAANLHKWICAPRGTAFLSVAASHQAQVHPTVVSHYLDEGFAKEFGWQGTRDLSSWLTAPAALKFWEGFGMAAVMDHNHQMAVWAQQMLCERWQVEAISPIDGSMLGSMATVVLPPPLDRMDAAAAQVFQQRLYSEYQIEAPLMNFGGKHLLRVSCQVYNVAGEYEYLAETILKMR